MSTPNRSETDRARVTGGVFRAWLSPAAALALLSAAVLSPGLLRAQDGAAPPMDLPAEEGAPSPVLGQSREGSLPGDSGEPEDRPPAVARLLVLGVEEGWPVWVDGRFRGRIPAWIDSLTPGQVVVEVGLPLEEPDWFRPWTQRMVLEPSAIETLRVEPLQRLRLQTRPAGAQVRIGYEEPGRTPLNLLLPAGRVHPLALKADDHVPEQILYDPQGKRDSTLVLDLERVQRMSIPPVQTGSSWIGRAQTLLPVAAVLLGGFGVWARNEADSAYEDYLETVDRSRMSDKLDRARGYDRLASACWISAEVCVLGAVTAWLVGSRREHGLVLDMDGDGRARVGLRLPTPGRSGAGAAGETP